MDLLHGVGDFFSLDIGTGAIRIVQLDGNSQQGWTLAKYAYVPVDHKVIMDDSELGRRRLGEAILGAIQQAGIKTKKVVMGLPARKTFTSVVETDNLPEKELAKVFKYEIEKYVPMAMSDAKADYILLGVSPNDPAKAEVLVSSTAKDYAESLMELVEMIGLDLVGMEPEPLAMARALYPVGALDARMMVDLGETSTDIVIYYQNQPRLVRSIPGGFGAMAKTVSASLDVQDDQARQFILRFGLNKDMVEGQVFKVLDNLLDSYVAELMKSMRFFQTKYLNAKIGGIILAGFGGMIPLFPEYIEAKTGVATISGDPWQLTRITPEQRQILAGVTNEFAVAVGLAERSND